MAGGDNMQVVNYWDVPWSQIEEPGFTYWIRQKPGPSNPLGYVKFIFPNNFSVYLHDTPNDYLFKRTNRSLSHGCIRLDQPFALAQYMLKGKGWSDTKIEEAMKQGEEEHVPVAKTPVYILYFTTWIDEEGKLNVRDDIYELDKKQKELIDQIV